MRSRTLQPVSGQVLLSFDSPQSMFLAESLSPPFLAADQCLALREGPLSSRLSDPIFRGSFVRWVWLCQRPASEQSWQVSCRAFFSAGGPGERPVLARS